MAATATANPRRPAAEVTPSIQEPNRKGPSTRTPSVSFPTRIGFDEAAQPSTDVAVATTQAQVTQRQRGLTARPVGKRRKSGTNIESSSGSDQYQIQATVGPNGSDPGCRRSV